MEHLEGLTAETKIRRVALALFAERGYGGSTVRAIAEAAGVSPGLIIRHYGSKEGLREAIITEVVETIVSFIENLLPDIGTTIDEAFEAPEAGFRELFTTRPELGAYIRRLFFDGDRAGLYILQQFMQAARTISAAFEERGWMRIAPDRPAGVWTGQTWSGS